MRLFRILIVFCSIIAFSTVTAQTLTVESFRLLEYDLTANTRGTTEIDQNGEIAALIKVVTTETDFTFSIGMLGIVKTIQKAGEIWVYVPHSTQRISISHQKFGVLRDYYFDIPIDKGRTYELRLNTGRPRTQYDSSKKQKISIKISPPDASLILNGMSVELDAKGEAVREMAHGQFDYFVQAEGFFPEDGQFVVDEEHKTLIIDDLKPITGKLSVRINPLSATVLVDGKQVGNTSVEPVELQIGRHEVEVSAKGYRTERQSVTILEDQTTDISFTLSQVAVFQFTSSPDGVDITIDKQKEGATPFSKELTTGTYMIKASKSGYKDYSISMQLSSSEPTVHVNLKRIYNYKREFYLEGNARVGAFTSLGATMGGYINNFNLEGSYLVSSVKSETIFWGGDNIKPVESWYTPDIILSSKFGYGIPVSTRYRITPQIGFFFIKLKESVDGEGVMYANGAYNASGLLSLRISAAIIDHVAISVSPEYALSINKSKGYKALSEISPEINKWGEGFNVKLGLTVFM